MVDIEKIKADSKAWVPKDCKGCGMCCRKYVVRLWSEDLSTVPKRYIDRKVLEFAQMKRRKNGSCWALNEKTNECKIYDSRPSACRYYGRGTIECITAILHVSHDHIPLFKKTILD